MSDKKMWMGTLYPANLPGTSSSSVNAKMQWVPAPDPEMSAAHSGWSAQLDFENGLADIVRSAQTHRVYNMEWGVREASGAQGLDLIRNYQQRLYGPGLIYFADPMEFGRNLLPPAWAAPGLIEQGWKGIFGTAPTYSNTAANSYGQPARKATFTVTGTASVVPTVAQGFAVIPIPPTHTLWLGFSAAKTNTGVIRVRPINADGSYASTTDLTLISETSSTRLNASFSGATYKAVEIYITHTASDTSTVTITSGMAQLWKTGVTPTTTGLWIAGGGNTGCKFTTEAIPETYTLIDSTGSPRHLKGMAATLTECGNNQT